MASTYVNDLRLEEMATGDQSGTWGDTTNTNLELIAEAFSYGTQASFSSDADATTTIADGASDPARSLYLKVTSGASLTATRTLTIAPNTVSKVWIIENATSGSQSINISQGSGANVTIPNGDVKVIYTDGAGAGAAVVDAFTNLTSSGTITATNLAGTLTTAAQPNITSVGTLTGLTTTGDINFGDNDKAIFGAGSDLQIYHNGTNSFIDEVGTGILYIRAATDLRLTNANSSKLYANFEDGGASKLYYDNGLKLLTTSAGVDITGTLTTSSTINVNNSSGYGNIELGGASGGFVDFKTPFSDDHDARIIYSGSFLQISTAGDEPILLKHNNVDKLVTSSAGIAITGRTLVSDDQTNDWIKQEVSGTTSTISLGNTEGTGATAQWSYNRASGLLSGNIGSAAGTNFMTVKGTGNIGFGTDDPDGKVHILKNSVGTVSAATDANTLVLEDTNTGMTFLGGNTSVTRIRFGDADSNARGQVFYNHNSDSFGFQTAGSTKLTLTQDGELGVGLTNPSDLLDVRGDGADTYIRVGSDSGAGSDTARIGKIDSNKDFIIQASVGTTSSNTIFKRNTSVEVARFDTSGNFGLGTDSPDTIMEIVGADPILTIRDTDTGQSTANARIRFAESAGGDILDNYWDVGLEPTQSLTFSKNGTEYARFNTNGNLGIGTDNPTNKLEIVGAKTLVAGIPTNNISVTDSTSLAANTGGAINFSGVYQTGGATTAFASIEASKETATHNEYGGALVFKTRQDQGSQNEHMRITSTGAVIIGGTSPLGSATFTVDSDSAAIACFDGSSASGGYLQFRNNNTAKGVLGFGSNAGASSTDSMILGSTSGNLEFHANNAEKMRINTSGDVIIGKTTSTNNNEAGIYMIQSGAIVATRSGDTAALFNRTTNDGSVVILRRQNVTVGSISVTGSATTYNTSSDARLKDVTGEARGLEVINELNPVSYNWKADGKADEGLIAQEVQEIVPNAVSQNKEDEMYQMDYSKLVVHLVKGMKEQQEQIEALQSKINLLKGE